ncbi:hypothetical protein TNCV_3802691 [Trichonephila clavipes]|nr:hypothetical protein TNCV_3802691 [Trichonephila clavipes]
MWGRHSVNYRHLTCHRQQRSMERFTNIELADIAEGNARAGSLRGNPHSERGPCIPTDHGFQHILFHTWNKMCWISFEGVRVPCWEFELLTNLLSLLPREA